MNTDIATAITFAEYALTAYHKRCAILRKQKVLGSLSIEEWFDKRRQTDHALNARLTVLSQVFGIDVQKYAIV